MKKMTAALASAAIGGALLISGGTASAAEETSVEIVGIAPNPIVLPATGETVVTFTVEATDDIDALDLYLKPKEDTQDHLLVGKAVTRKQNAWIFSVPFTSADPVGKWQATALGLDTETGRKEIDKATFTVEIPKDKLTTRFKRFEVEPDVVQRGKKILFSGRLQANNHGWTDVKNAEVGIYYRANQRNRWAFVTSANTDSAGKFFARARADQSGNYRAVFRGDDQRNRSNSASFFVRVTQ